VYCHSLPINERTPCIVEKRRKQSPEKTKGVNKVVLELLKEHFIKEMKYTSWLSTTVLIKKSINKWRMCVDYTDLNRVCPKDARTLPNINNMVDNSSRFKLLSFMDTHYDYNQIPMDRKNHEKGNYCSG
jgi:hypothetical protein